MVSILNRLFFVVMFSLLVSGIYSVGFSGESYAGDNNGTTGGGPAISDDGSSDDGSSDGKSHDDGSSDGNSGGKKKKPKKQWLTDGNADIDSSQNFLGTTDDADLVIKTDNTEKVRVTTDGNIGIGTDSPTGTLHVEGGSADGVAGGKDIILDAQDGGPDGGAGGNILLLPGASGDGSASTGKVLVGTDSSILSLDVNGAIRIRGGAPLVGWVLTALDSDGTAVWQDLNVNDADSDPTNEFQTLVRTDNNVTLSNGGGTVSVADDDSDTANELQSLSVSGTDLTLTNGGGTVSIADNDNDTSNELNTSFSLSGNSLEITDAGGTLSVNLAGLGDDADADPTNELQTLSQVGDDVTLSNGGGTISVADGDNNSANELNTGASLTGTDLKISDAGGDKTVDLSSLVNDADADPVNEIQAMSQVGNSVTLSNGGGTINVADGDSDSGNELNTGASLAGNSLSITDAGGAVTVDLSALADDADADPTNELNTGASLTGTSLKITDGGGDKIVDLSTLVNDADADSTNELNASVVLNGSTLELTDAGGTITADLSSLDNSEVDPEVGPNTTNFMPKWDGSALVTGTIFDDGNKVGIGTINPETSLHIVTDNAFPLIAERVVDNNTGPLVRLRKSRGAINLKSAVNHNDYIGQLSFDGWNGSSYVKGASIIGKVDGIPSSGNIPGRMEFLTNNGSGPSEKMRIDKNGNVGIGTINPGAKLDIFGNIKIEDGTEGADKVLTSDANGVGTWQDAAADDDWTISGNDIYSAVTGNVGVGTIAPATKLDVNGTVTATGLTVPGGSIITDAVTSNTFVGVGTGSSNTTGTSNTAIGAQALRSNTTGTENTAFGQGALQTNTGINNTATGALALLRNTTGNHNTANGYHALVNNTTGSRNVAVGLNALANNTTASNNTATGNSALVFNVTGDSNTANGSWSLMKNVSGSYNSAYGGGALRENTTGDGNTALGYVALNNNTTGQNNTAVGHSALQKNTTGANNVAFGPIALFSNTTGQGNIAIGREALRNNTTGSANHSIGVESMWSNTTGTNNVVNGATALKANTTGNNNVAIGRSALIKNTEGTNNTAIGGTALAFNIIGNHNTAIGNSAGFSSTGSSNVFLGYEAGKNETGDNKLHIANNSTNTLIYGDFASGRVGIGTTAPDSELHVEGNIKMVDGSQAAGLVLTSDANGVGTWQSGSGDNDWTIDGTDMHSTVTGNVGIGTTTPGSKLDVTGTITATGLTVPGGSITTDAIASNTFLGQSAGSSNTTGTQNTAVGNGTLQLNTTGANNNAFGHGALYANTIGTYNNAFGLFALNSNTEGQNNIAIGTNALRNSTTASNNNAVGGGALTSNTTGNNNVSDGYSALMNNTTGSSNTANGSFSLLANITGNHNTAVGHNAGHDSIGSNNVFLGHNAGYYETGDKKLHISIHGTDTLIYGDFANHKVGISTTNPGQTLTVGGTMGILEGGATPSFHTIFQGGDQAADITYTLPTGQGGADTVLTNDGSGILSWGAVASGLWTLNGSDATYDTGNVGIGTTTPATELDVSGTITATGLTVPGDSLITDSDIPHNTFLGLGAGITNTGASNTGLGHNALRISTGGSNTAIGWGTLTNNTTGSQNTAVGNSALQNNTTGVFNTALGLGALKDNTEGDRNTATGYTALRNNTTGIGNVANGWGALAGNTTGGQNHAIGYNSLVSNTAGSGNCTLGGGTLNKNIDGDYNIAIGHAALRDKTAGDYNIAIGSGAMQFTEDANNNIAAGRSALSNHTTGDENIALGLFSLTGNTTGTGNVAIGTSAGYSSAAGSNNVFIGKYAGVNGIGSGNVFLGYEAGKNESEDNKLHIGNSATNTLIYGDFASGRVGIGTTAPDAELHVEGNIKMVDGSQAAGLVLTSDANGVGTWQAGAGDNDWTIDGADMHSSVTGNVGIGTTTPATELDVNGRITGTGLTVPGGSITTDAIASNTFLGQSAGSSNTTGTQNTAVGNGTLQLNTTGANNNAFGHGALYANTIGTYNNAFGLFALNSNTEGQNNIAIGTNALRNSTTASSNTAIGNGVLQSTTGGTNTGIGASALVHNLAGSSNVAIGYEAMNWNTSGSNNVASGHFALKNNTTANSNTAIGFYSLSKNTTGSLNTAIGNGALLNNLTGTNNVAIGGQAGANAIGSNNIFIGAHVGGSQTTGDNKLHIGFGNNTLVYGDFSNNLVGINTTDPGQTLTVGGTMGILEGGGTPSFHTIFQGGDQAADITYTLPTGQGGTNTVLTNDGSGILSWGAVASGLWTLNVNDAYFNTGNVGIGTTTPETELDVAGTITATGLTAPGGNIVTDAAIPSNTFLGLSAGSSNTTGIQNTAIGGSALLSNTTGRANTAVGLSALRLNEDGVENTAVGLGALQFNTSGSWNTALGLAALQRNTTGVNNTAVGLHALVSNTTGASNIAVGREALFSNITGGSNTAIGKASLKLNTTGGANTAIGVNALRDNTIGQFNTVIGGLAMLSNIDGIRNVANGYQALFKNTSGSGNVAIGLDCMKSNTTGNLNIAIGQNSLPSNSTSDNNTAIGFEAGHNTLGAGNVFLGFKAGWTETGSDTLYIANSGANTLIYGDFAGSRVGINTTTPGGLLGLKDGNTFLDVDGSNNLTFTDSVTGTKTLAELVGGGGLWNTATGGIHYSSGKVGIGTTTPGAGLHIAQDVDTNAGGLAVVNSGNTRGGYFFADSSDVVRIESGGSGIGDLAINTGGGNVSIGTTSASPDTENLTIDSGVGGAGGIALMRGVVTTSTGGLGDIGFYNGSTTKRARILVSADGSENSSWFRFYTSTGGTLAENFVIKGNGNVGIGTTGPGNRLHITGRSATPSLRLGSTSEGNYWDIGRENAATGDFLFIGTNGADNPVERMRINENTGNVGIGTTNPGSFRLAVNGSAAKPGAGSWSNFSDERLKTIYGNFDTGLDEVLKLQPINYRYNKDNPMNLPDEGNHIGFSAQKVQKVIPEAVTENSEGYLLVNNDPIMWAMLNAIKELKTENDLVKNENSQLKEKLTALTERQSAIEDMLLALSTNLPKEKLVKLGISQ